jgi:hypothetical protein
MSDPKFVETTEPDEAFAALADETRVAILQALWDIEDHVATFSELREAVGVRDSGQFNYHLDKLTDEFVRKTDDGYELTMAGVQVVGAVEGGSFTMNGRIDPIDIEEPCPACGDDRTLRYEDDVLSIECDSCELSVEGMVPPSALAAADEASLPEVATRYFRSVIGTVGDGFCLYCDGPVEPTVRGVDDRAPDDAEVPDQLRDLPFVEYVCGRCGEEVGSDLGLALLAHPAVGGFYFDHGIDVREASLWDFVAWDTETAWVDSREAFRAVVTYEVDGDTLTLVVDDELTVHDVERSDR